MSVPQSETVLETSSDARSDYRPATAAPAFVAQLSERVRRTRSTIDSAAADGEDDLAEAHLAELESVLRLAEAHGVQLPDAAAYLAQRRSHSTGSPSTGSPSAGDSSLIDLTSARAHQEA